LEGWVDRDKLHGFAGRTRKPQMALAAEFGLQDYAQPAGGCCFLTDRQYSQKLADLWKARGSRRYELDDIMLLKVGRHLRPRPHFKMIIGREDGENKFLHGYRKQYTHLFTRSHKGPLVLIDGEVTQEDIDLAAQIAARFSQGRNADKVELEVQWLEGDRQILSVVPITVEAIQKDWYL
jgi:tRNA U34 2-thiouridine synthase MnmA/TrmU